MKIQKTINKTTCIKAISNMTGFTLLELMITVAVVGILAGLATAYYGDNLLSSRRTDARSALLSNAGSLEKCKTLYGTYINANCSISNGDSVDSSEGYYSIGVTSTATTFTLTASPVPGGPQANDTKCTSLSLDNLGRQTAAGSTPADCW